MKRSRDVLYGWHLGGGYGRPPHPLRSYTVLFACVYLAKGFLISTKSGAGPHYPEAVILFQKEERASALAQKKLELSEQC